jgi:hypothetical protein
MFFTQHREFNIKFITCFTPINKGIWLKLHGHNQIDYNHHGIKLQHAIAHTWAFETRYCKFNVFLPTIA